MQFGLPKQEILFLKAFFINVIFIEISKLYIYTEKFKCLFSMSVKTKSETTKKIYIHIYIIENIHN